jgi:hypothetical protein
MWIFLTAGLIYLSLIAVILLIKPSFMFREDGTWKEFGIGRNPKTHTVIPLWLYSIVAALVSYIVVLLLSSTFRSVPVEQEEIVNIRMSDLTGKKSGSPELLPGYYMLNKTQSRIKGMPKYVYLGPEEE